MACRMMLLLLSVGSVAGWVVPHAVTAPLARDVRLQSSADSASRATSTRVAPADEIARRRNFAIISHPDAGKTTMTEKLLL